MAQKTLNVKMQVRRDTATNWETVNPILAAGELGYDTTNKQTKIGDGVTAWKDLSYFVKQEPLSVSTFADTDWTNIARVAENGTASEYFNVGDEKTIQLSTGEQVTVVILGFDHDDKTSSGKAGISIGMKHLLATKYKMNASHTNVGGWDTCKLRTDTMATLLSQLPSDLRKVIKAVDKKASAGNKSKNIITSSDKLWLLAAAEIYSKTSIEGSSTSDVKNNAAIYKAEGEQYAYYKNLIKNNGGGTATNSLLIKNLSDGDGSAETWWLRSPYIASSSSFRCIYSSGSLGSCDDYVSYAYGVSFGFCV